MDSIGKALFIQESQSATEPVRLCDSNTNTNLLFILWCCLLILTQLLTSFTSMYTTQKQELIPLYNLKAWHTEPSVEAEGGARLWWLQTYVTVWPLAGARPPVWEPLDWTSKNKKKVIYVMPQKLTDSCIIITGAHFLWYLNCVYNI